MFGYKNHVALFAATAAITHAHIAACCAAITLIAELMDAAVVVVTFLPVAVREETIIAA